MPRCPDCDLEYPFRTDACARCGRDLRLAVSEDQYRASLRDHTCAACCAPRPWWYWLNHLLSYTGWYRCKDCTADFCPRCTPAFHAYARLDPESQDLYWANGKHSYSCPYCGAYGWRYDWLDRRGDW